MQKKTPANDLWRSEWTVGTGIGTWELDVLWGGCILPPHQVAALQVVDQQLVQAGVSVQIHQEVFVLLHLEQPQMMNF